MAANDAIEVARRFHDRTAHSPQSVRTSGHVLDWDIKPFPFKVYTELGPIPLPRALDPVATPTLDALALGPRRAAADLEAPLTLDALATLLYDAAGVTKKKTYPGGVEVLFRAAPSTGALYQTEVYVAAGAVQGLEPGLYHFCPGDFTLRRLRAGDVRAALARAAADETLGRRAATVVLSAIYWRNTWKYQARGYRHLFWDSGTMLANLDAVARALGLAPRLLTGFVDAEVNALLGLDADREAALELVAVGPEGDPAPPTGGLEPIAHPTLPLSSEEVDYPALREVHRASALDSAHEVAEWRARSGAWARGEGPSSTTVTTTGLGGSPGGGRGLGETIQRRGSTRRFSQAPLALAELGAALWAASRPVDADVPLGLVDLYLVVNHVEGLEPGSYRYRPDAHGLELLRRGQYRAESAYLCLEQPLGGDAAAGIYFLAPLDAILRAFGNRGYRLANLAAGLAGGRAYLAAYALGVGASGLTFYDGHVVDFFSPHAAEEDAIFVTALGRSARAAS